MPNSYSSSVPARVSSSPASYDFVPPPRQASEPVIQSTYGFVGRPQSLNIKSSQHKVPVNKPTRSEQPVNSTYGVVNFNRNQGATLPAQVPSSYVLLNYSGDKSKDKNEPVNSIYGVVQAPTQKPISKLPDPQCQLSSGNESTAPLGQAEQSQRSNVSAPAQNAQAPPVSPRKKSFNANKSVPDSSYEIVELPRMDSLSRSSQSTPISIPSQHRSLPRAMDYDTVVSPPLKRVEPIGAPKSPYGNVDFDKSEEGRKEGDGLAKGLPETRGDPEGAKKRDMQSPSGREVNYENVVLPMRTGSVSSQNESIYQNMPVSTPNYEYNVPRSQPRSAIQVTSSAAEEDRYLFSLLKSAST